MTKQVKGIFKEAAAIMILITLSVVLMAGCSKSQGKANNPSVKDISEKIKGAVDISDMRDGDGEKLNKFYKISPDDIEEFALYTASSNIKADEIAIIKVKDAKDIEGINEKISKRIEKQSESFKDYAPEEYFLIEKHVLKTQGNYILFAVSKDADKIQGVFDEFFK